jgi:hypothetical protein
MPARERLLQTMVAAHNAGFDVLGVAVVQRYDDPERPDVHGWGFHTVVRNGVAEDGGVEGRSYGPFLVWGSKDNVVAPAVNMLLGMGVTQLKPGESPDSLADWLKRARVFPIEFGPELRRERGLFFGKSITPGEPEPLVTLLAAIAGRAQVQ